MRRLFTLLTASLLLVATNSKAQVVINEVYGGGGNSGAPYQNDFIELYNNSASAVTMTNWSVQYNSAAGTTWLTTNRTIFSGTIPANGYFLIQLASNAAVGALLPTPDATGTINMSGTAGKVVLCNNSTMVSNVANPTDVQIVDKVGYGASATGFETSPAPGTTNATSDQRNPIGTDTGNNSLDFTSGAPSPKNTITGSSATISIAGATNATEGAGNGTFTISFSTATAATTTFDYSIGGTATFTTDYSVTLSAGTPTPLTATSGTITVPSGVSSITVTVTPVDDATPEPTETVSFTLSNPSAGYVLGTTSATINLLDNDIAPASFTGSYSQDFNTLATSGTSSSVPLGWAFSEGGANANTLYNTGAGASNAGDTYSFGTGTATDRAFGGLRSSNLAPTIGAMFTNNTGATVTSLSVTYTGEQWRLGATGRSDKLDFQYSTDATNLATGTWVNADGLDFIAPNSSGTVGALDGNATANRVTYTFTIAGIAIPNGASFLFRWVDNDAAGSDDGLGIDDLSMILGCTPPTNQPTTLNLTPALTSIAGSFTAAVAGATPADAYLVIMSTSSSLTVQPVAGTAYAIDDVIGNGQVISIDGSTSFTASGLNPATTYYFFVYANSSATNCYNITSPLIGNISTDSPPICTPPATQTSNLTATNITGTSMDLNYTRGDGDNILIVARTATAVNADPINGVTYAAGAQIGTGNFVIYNGPANTFSYTGLSQNTNYNFALYEYSNTNNCYLLPALTGNFTTACVSPVNPTAFNASSQNGAVVLSWSNPANTCFDEVLVIASNATITGNGGDFAGPGDPIFTGPNQVVFRGIGTGVTVTGLTNGSTYYFKIFTRNNGSYSSGVQITGTPFDPSTGYLYLYGNLHSHSSYSDGNKDNTSKIPQDDYAFARDALCVDFWGISEHNHATAGMNISNFPLGYNQANTLNGVPGPSGNSIVTLWGMEWGVISGGGHVVTYGFDDQLVGWEPGNYNIFCQKNDYTSLFNLIDNQPNAFATLAHPNNTDFGNIANSVYDGTKDNAIVGVAVESGPAFSTSTTYNDFPSQLNYLSYYKTMLAKGYRLGATMDQDNHNMTFGTSNSNRLVVLSSAKSRAEIVNAIRSMRFYASEDCNAKVDYKLNSNVIGSSVTGSGVPAITLGVTDLDGENAATIELWGGVMGGSVPAAPIKTFAGVNSMTFNSGNVENVQPDNSTYYYFAVITQEDSNKIVTSPIWFSRNDAVLPVTLINFKAYYNSTNNTTLLKWSTAQEINSRSFVVERSIDGGTSWMILGTVNAAGSSNAFRNYDFTDLAPKQGTDLYRLREVNIDNSYTFSKIAFINIRSEANTYFTVYPNPSHGYTYIYTTVSTASKATIQLIDISGRLVKQMQTNILNSTPTRLDVSNVSPGVYFIRINYDGNSTSAKLVIK
jgi:hypothetical protein